jgi:hypothetical protein
MNPPGFGEANDLSCLETIDDNFALVFFPFHTYMVPFQTLEQLLDEFNAHDLVYRATFLNGDGPWDRSDFYVGKRTVDGNLPNLKRFFDYNNWSNDRTWTYDVAVMVAYNNTDNVIVDVPLSCFPWCIDYFGVSGTNILSLPIPDITDDHILTAACQKCYAGNKRCFLARSGDCGKCGKDENGRSECKAQIARELDNLRAKNLNTLLQERSTLCPAFQYLIASCSVVYNYSKAYTAADRAVLHKIVTTDLVRTRDLAKEAFVRDKCSSYQLVIFENGHFKNLESCDVGDRVGFPSSVQSKKSKHALRMIFPTFGMASPHKAYSFLNAALAKPGEIFVADFVLWDRRLKTTTTRMMILVQMDSADHVYVMVGWV